MTYTFDELMQLAEREAGAIDVPTRVTIVKELLHYDILLALSRSEMSQRLVFQGGTALRLCYGGQRYSEDLDFVCGNDAKEPFDIGGVTTLLRKQVADRYGLTLEVKEPGPDRLFGADDGAIVVKRWAMKFIVPGFASKQVIHFEVCNVPAYKSVPTLLQPRYGFLSDVYSDIALNAEPLDEILADKVVALIGRSHVKGRDLWDLRWLEHKGLVPDAGMVRDKLEDYGIVDVAARIDRTLDALRSSAAPTKLREELVRFVTPSVAKRLLDNPASLAAYLEHAQHLLEQMRDDLIPQMSP